MPLGEKKLPQAFMGICPIWGHVKGYRKVTWFSVIAAKVVQTVQGVASLQVRRGVFEGLGAYVRVLAYSRNNSHDVMPVTSQT